MVVFGLPVWAEPYSANRRNQYWKLRNHTRSHHRKVDCKSMLKDANYKFPASVKRARLAEMMTRSERGFLSYDGCQPQELRTFCVQRNIQVPGGGKPTKAQLVEVLEAADEEAEFSRVEDLPLELRVHIYTLYFRSLQKLEEPTPPLISKVSRLVREESLPVFYNTCTFVVKVIIGKPWRNWDSGFIFNELKYFVNMPKNHIKMIRNLSIENYLSGLATEVLTWNQGKVSFSSWDDKLIDKPSKIGQDAGIYLEDFQGEPQGEALSSATLLMLMKIIMGALRGL